MTNSNSTKRALLTSALALLMCVTMLVGTTFAWFTDTASTGVNKIQAGNLDIELQMKDASGKWVTAEGKTLDFVKAPGAENEAILWEPGCTYNLQELQLVNKSNLALKYKVLISGIKGDAKLNEAIDWTIQLGGQNLTIGEEMYWLPTEDTTKAFTISGSMKKDAGNQYQGLSIEGISITVVATQYTFEHDSKDDQYDKDAQFPEVKLVEKATNEALATAVASLNNGGTVVLPAGEYTIPTSAGNKEFTISGTKDTVVKIDTVNVNAGGADVTFKGVTINGQKSGNYAGLGNGCNVSFVDCTINGKISLYGEKASFVNCTFNNKNDYSVWTWGGKDVDFIGCTFNSGGKALLVYGEYVQTNIDIINCTFNDDGTLNTAKAAIEIGSDRATDTHNINIKNVTVNGFAVNPEGISTASNIWANKNSMPKDRLNVVINGVDVY